MIWSVFAHVVTTCYAYGRTCWSYCGLGALDSSYLCSCSKTSRSISFIFVSKYCRLFAEHYTGFNARSHIRETKLVITLQRYDGYLSPVRRIDW